MQNENSSTPAATSPEPKTPSPEPQAKSVQAPKKEIPLVVVVALLAVVALLGGAVIYLVWDRGKAESDSDTATESVETTTTEETETEEEDTATTPDSSEETETLETSTESEDGWTTYVNTGYGGKYSISFPSDAAVTTPASCTANCEECSSEGTCPGCGPCILSTITLAGYTYPIATLNIDPHKIDETKLDLLISAIQGYNWEGMSHSATVTIDGHAGEAVEGTLLDPDNNPYYARFYVIVTSDYIYEIWWRDETSHPNQEVFFEMMDRLDLPPLN